MVADTASTICQWANWLICFFGLAKEIVNVIVLVSRSKLSYAVMLALKMALMHIYLKKKMEITSNTVYAEPKNDFRMMYFDNNYKT